MDNLITTDSEQNIHGNITIKGALIVFGNEAYIDRLTTNNKVFGVNFNALIDNVVPATTVDRFSMLGEKWFNHITIGSAIVEPNTLWNIGSTKQVLEQIEARLKHVLLEGPIHFQNDFAIDDLIFYDYLNDISRNDFGKQWLLYETDQV